MFYGTNIYIHRSRMVSASFDEITKDINEDLNKIRQSPDDFFRQVYYLFNEAFTKIFEMAIEKDQAFFYSKEQDNATSKSQSS